MNRHVAKLAMFCLFCVVAGENSRACVPLDIDIYYDLLYAEPGTYTLYNGPQVVSGGPVKEIEGGCGYAWMWSCDSGLSWSFYYADGDVYAVGGIGAATPGVYEEYAVGCNESGSYDTDWAEVVVACPPGKTWIDGECVVVTDDCWGIAQTTEAQGSCYCDATLTKCVSTDAELRSVGWGRLEIIHKDCVKVVSGSYGYTQCGPTSPQGVVTNIYACIDEVRVTGVLLCAELNALVCTVQCYAAIAPCSVNPGSWECIDAAKGCYECLTGEGINCGCLAIQCGGSSGYKWIGDVVGDPNGVYGEKCKRP